MWQSILRKYKEFLGSKIESGEYILTDQLDGTDFVALFIGELWCYRLSKPCVYLIKFKWHKTEFEWLLTLNHFVSNLAWDIKFESHGITPELMSTNTLHRRQDLTSAPTLAKDVQFPPPNTAAHFMTRNQRYWEGRLYTNNPLSPRYWTWLCFVGAAPDLTFCRPPFH